MRVCRGLTDRGNRKSDESCISKWKVEIVDRTFLTREGLGPMLDPSRGRALRVGAPKDCRQPSRVRKVRSTISTFHFEMQDSSDFRFLITHGSSPSPGEFLPDKPLHFHDNPDSPRGLKYRGEATGFPTAQAPNPPSSVCSPHTHCCRDSPGRSACSPGN